MTLHAISVYDPPITLGDHAILEDTHVIVQQPSYGRILFAGPVCGAYVVGQHVIIRNNHFEMV